MTARVAHRLWLWSALCTLLVGPWAAAQQRSGEIDLRPKFEKGQEIRYQLEMVSSTRNDSAARPARPGAAPGRPQPKQPPSPPDERLDILDLGAMPERSQSSTTMGLVMRVTEVSPEGIATVDMVFESMKFRTTVGEEVFEFDSAAPKRPGDQDPIAMLLIPIVGTRVTLTVDRNGNITQATGGEALAMLGQVISGAPGGGQGAAKLFGPIFSAHPTKGVAKMGESWEHSDRVQTGLLGDFKMTTRHTLRGLQGRDAIVAISGRVEPESEQPREGGFQIQNSSYNGSYVWDTVKGQLSRMESSMSVRLTGNVGSQPLDSRNESTVKITRIARPGRP
jgi:hypothetical protein